MSEENKTDTGDSPIVPLLLVMSVIGLTVCHLFTSVDVPIWAILGDAAVSLFFVCSFFGGGSSKPAEPAETPTAKPPEKTP